MSEYAPMRWLLPVSFLLLTACSRGNQTVVLSPETPSVTTPVMNTPVSSAIGSNSTQTSASSSLTVVEPVTEQVSATTPSQPLSAELSTEIAPSSSACAQLPNVTKFVAPPATPKGITGRVGLFVARLQRGTKDFALEKATWLNPTGQFPLASNFKTAVMFELMRAVDRGEVKLTERFKVTPANQSYGRYPYDNTPVMGMASNMIQWSDNTATDILYRRIGLEALHPTLEQLGLCRTRLLMTTKAWWTAQAGFGGADFPKYGLVSASRKFASYPFEAQLKMAERLDTAAQNLTAEKMRRYLDNGYFAGRNGGVQTMSEIDRNLQNASTPQEWARYMHHAFVDSDLSNANRQRFRDTMYHGKGRYMISVPFKYFGGKSGNTARILTYSGYLETLSGDKVIYVYMNDSSQNLATRDETPKAFNLINAALKKVMRSEDLIKPKPPQKIKLEPASKAAKTVTPAVIPKRAFDTSTKP
jgi:beta-lactamase class A